MMAADRTNRTLHVNRESVSQFSVATIATPSKPILQWSNTPDAIGKMPLFQLRVVNV
jgi:hypothetical protein